MDRPLEDSDKLAEPLSGGAVVYHRSEILSSEEATAAYSALRQGLDWQRRTIVIYGRDAREGRDTAFYGDPGTSYRYSGVAHQPLPWSADTTGWLKALKDLVGRICGYRFNFVLANLYRPGDSIGFHSDDERDLVPGSPIASVSLGESRLFTLEPKGPGHTIHLLLKHGSLLVMAGQTQRRYKHEVPPMPNVAGDRVNLTFRVMRTPTIVVAASWNE